ncbi:MAG: MazG family protein, partial [Ruminiclostridium sp.]|nr:MazG family protein [Ruminiclostridium sp.]
EELGDILFQAVFHCQIENERGGFTFDDICDDVAKKMIYRHPHVFGDVSVENSDEVLKNWDKLKKESKGQETLSDTFDSVPKILPALMRGQKIGKRASNAGVDFGDTKQIIELLRNQLDDLELAISTKNDKKIEDDFGDVLLSCCNLSRFIKKDSEKALTIAINKFIIRFRGFEKALKENGKTLESLTDEEKIKFLCGIE